MPDFRKYDPSRPAAPRWAVPVAVLIAIALGAGATLLVRHRPAGPSPTPSAAGASPAATAAVLAVPSASPEDNRFRPPKMLATRPVTYPEQALLNRVEGVVRVKFSVDENGQVTNTTVVKSSGSVMLDAMALEYDLRKWTFQPATLDGKPVAGALEQEFEFHLDPNEQRALAEERLKAPVGTPDAPYPAAALRLRPQGAATITVSWTPAGLVDTINLAKSSGSNTLDNAALRFAFTHWHIDPKDGTDKQFTKTMTFTAPLGPNDTPPPLSR